MLSRSLRNRSPTPLSVFDDAEKARRPNGAIEHDPVNPYDVCNLADTIAQPRAGIANAWIEKDELAITGGDGDQFPGHVLQEEIGLRLHAVQCRYSTDGLRVHVLSARPCVEENAKRIADETAFSLRTMFAKE